MNNRKNDRKLARDLLASPSVSPVSPNGSILKTVSYLIGNNLLYIPVCDEMNKFIGIITVYDILDHYINNDISDTTNKQYINPEHYMILSPDEYVTQEMFVNRVGCVCQKGALLGVIDYKSFDQHYEWNMTVLQQIEQKIAEYEMIFKYYYDSIYDIAGDGTILYANTATDRIIGKDATYVQGKNIMEMEFEKLYFPSIFHTVIARKETSTIIQNVENDRKAIVTGVPVFSDNGEIIRIIVATRDVNSLVEDIERSSLLQDMNGLKKRLQEEEKLADRYFTEIRNLRTTKNEEKRLSTKNRKMQKVLDLIKKVAPTDSSVLILGESGTGKDLIANMIHNMSNRSSGPYIKINCGAIPESILESELFGYDPGAFTGAGKGGKSGLMELADGGTLFLNEIGEMPLNLQVKLLQAIQDKKFMRVGGNKEISVDIRIISATNIDLAEAVRCGSFREDLYYRLNVIPVEIPALRDRKEDIPGLSIDFLNKFNTQYSRTKTFSSSAMNILINHEWPGNVRELENLIERLVVVSEGETIYPYDFPESMQLSKSPYLKPFEFIEGKSLRDIMDEYEKEILRQAYDKYGNTTKLAELLEVNQSTIARKMQKYNLY